MFSSKKLEQKAHKCKENRRKELKIIRIYFHLMENSMSQWKLKLFLGKAFKNSISLYSIRLTKKKREVTHITSIINEKRDITTNPVHSKSKKM